MEPAAQAVLAVAGVSVTVILGALLAIARRDRRLAGGRTTARTIDAAMAAPVSRPASAPKVPAPTIPAPQTPVAQVPVVGALAVPTTAPRARRLRFGRRAGT